ncbi:MAG: hypothetical protein V3V16_02545 [Melioribacteraceae bacterium]
MKTLLLITTISIGIFFPFAHSYSFLIKYLLMIMLFFSFLNMEVKVKSFTKNHIALLALNILIPISSFFIIKNYNLELAQVVFITTIAPTAIASPVIISLLKGKVEFVVISILITNFSIAFLLPFILPSILGSSSTISVFDILPPVSVVFLLPYALAKTVKLFIPKLKKSLMNLNKYMFYILIVNINLGTSNASYYVRQEMSFSNPIIYQIAIASFVFCLLYFYLGRLVAPKNLRVEGGQSLGQKNNGFSLWIALAFISPLAVLGPVFYILFQNIYVSWQLHKQSKK